MSQSAGRLYSLRGICVHSNRQLREHDGWGGSITDFKVCQIYGHFVPFWLTFRLKVTCQLHTPPWSNERSEKVACFPHFLIWELKEKKGIRLERDKIWRSETWRIYINYELITRLSTIFLVVHEHWPNETLVHFYHFVIFLLSLAFVIFSFVFSFNNFSFVFGFYNFFFRF